MVGDKIHLNSLFDYGYIIFKGNGVSCDKENGLKYMKMTANQNFVKANETLGSIFFTGADIPYNLNEAAFYLKRALDLGSTKVIHINIMIFNFSNSIDDEKNASYIEMEKEIEVDETAKSIIQALFF